MYADNYIISLMKVQKNKVSIYISLSFKLNVFGQLFNVENITTTIKRFKSLNLMLNLIFFNYCWI